MNLEIEYKYRFRIKLHKLGDEKNSGCVMALFGIKSEET